jgi:hypothetical protein
MGRVISDAAPGGYRSVDLRFFAACSCVLKNDGLSTSQHLPPYRLGFQKPSSSLILISVMGLVSWSNGRNGDSRHLVGFISEAVDFRTSV